MQHAVIGPQAATDPVLEGLRALMRAVRPLVQHLAGDAAGRAQTQILGLLYRLGETRGSDLAGVLCVDPSVVSRQLATLADDGLIVRRSDPADARATLVALSPLGGQRLQHWHDAATALLDDRLADWSPADLDRAANVLHRLADDLAPRPANRGQL